MSSTARPKVLGQSAPGATTSTVLYTVPVRTETDVASISICNRGAAEDKYRLSISKAGAAITDGDYTHYDTPLPANDTLTIAAGLILQEGDIIRVRSLLGTLSFGVFGTETFPVDNRYAA